MGLLIVDLPRSWPRRAALDAAAEALREHGVRDWTRLELRTTTPTGTDLIRQFTFTYWAAPTRRGRVHNLRYSDLWERLGHADRAALLHVAAGGASGADVADTVMRVGGGESLLRDHSGTPHLPPSLRHFLRAMKDPRR
ncbi:hypothetical protein [Rhodococcus jostii]|uniref:Uncharacterized protein n=1 Tax=Rhodococcus jostii TaxID=132919 RepID=A0A1H4TNF7_RHOJO|nr:hypothetical protein [Rhodococcus jostii]SEC57760.1 hypothetical protein SAMN04490220_2002 [Rhodococcus jostii]